MSEHLERESNIGAKAPPSAVVSAAQDGLIDLTGDEDGAELPQHVRELIKRCLSGEEPIGRALHNNEPTKFSTQHVNICLLRVAGFRNGEIAAACGYTPTMVSIATNHPYGKKIIAELISSRGGRVLDIRSRLDEYASEVLDHVFNLAIGSQDLAVVSKVGFNLLDRAGYAPTQRLEVTDKREIASEGSLNRLASALEQSQSVDSHIMPVYIPSPPPDEGRGEVGASEPQARDSRLPGPEVEPLSGGGIRLAKVAGA